MNIGNDVLQISLTLSKFNLNLVYTDRVSNIFCFLKTLFTILLTYYIQIYHQINSLLYDCLLSVFVKNTMTQ